MHHLVKVVTMQDEVNPIYENRQSKVTGRPVVITAYYVLLML